MATELQQQRLRLDLGFAADDEDSISNATIDAIYVEVGEEYTNAASIKAATRVLALNRLIIQAATEVDYTQNATTERASQRYEHLVKEREKWQAKLDEAIAGTGAGSMRFGKTTRIPARIKSYPGT